MNKRLMFLFVAAIAFVLFSLSASADGTVGGDREYVHVNLVYADGEYACTQCGNTIEYLNETLPFEFSVGHAGQLKTGDTLTCSLFGQRKLVLWGDPDNDGRITAKDARFSLRAGAKLESPDAVRIKACDLDCNGILTADDARDLLRLSARLIPMTFPQFEGEDYIIHTDKKPDVNALSETLRNAGVYKYYLVSGRSTHSAVYKPYDDEPFYACELCFGIPEGKEIDFHDGAFDSVRGVINSYRAGGSAADSGVFR